jgi:hypothetical protein
MNRIIYITIIVTDYVNSEIYDEIHKEELLSSSSSSSSLSYSEELLKSINLDFSYDNIYLCPLNCSFYTMSNLFWMNSQKHIFIKPILFLDDRLFIDNLYKRNSLEDIKKLCVEIIDDKIGLEENDDYFSNYDNIAENYNYDIDYEQNIKTFIKELISKYTDDFKPILIILEKHIAEIFIKIAFDEDIRVNYGDVLNYFIVYKSEYRTTYDEDDNEIEIDYSKYKNYINHNEDYIYYYDIYKCPSLEILYEYIDNIPDDRKLNNDEITERFNIENTDFVKNNTVLNLIFKLLYNKYDKLYYIPPNTRYIRSFKRPFINLNLEFYNLSNNQLRDEYNHIYNYFYCIDFYINKNYNIYSLGDSLYKFNIFWNLTNDDKQIKIIPFSGSMFDNSIYRINEDMKDFMIEYFPNLLINNINFKDLIDKLKLGEICIITDYFHSGRSILTLLILFNHYEIPIANLYFLLISPDKQNRLHIVRDDELTCDIEIPYYVNLAQFDKIADTEITYPNKILLLNYGINNYYQFSENTNSRCLPTYKNWNNIPNDMYYKSEYGYNYYNCNVHTLLFYLFFINFYVNFFLIKKLEILQNRFSINYFIKNDKIESNIIESDIMKSISNKYLKYKYKYLKLKKKLIQY